MPVNPWGGFQQGTNQLLNILAAQREAKDRQTQNALRNKLLGRQVSLQEEEAQTKRQGEARALIGKLLPGVKDQASYTSARSFVLSQYPELNAASVPEEYNPQLVENLSRAYGAKPAEWKPTTKEEALELKTAGPGGKPINMPPWYDSMAKELMGSEYDTPEGQTKFSDWIATPEGKKASAQYRQKYASETATPLYWVQPTAEGYVPFSGRTGQALQPTGIGKTLPSEQIVAAQQIGTLGDTLKRVEENYDSSYVGPIDGRLGEVKGEWWGLPDEQGEFYADLWQVKNTLIYLYSGKQINESEYKRLRKQLPSSSLPDSTFKARMKSFKETLASIQKERAKASMGYGTNVPKKSSEKAPPVAIEPIEDYQEYIKYHFNKGESLETIMKSINEKAPEEYKQLLRQYLLSLDIKKGQ